MKNKKKVIAIVSIILLFVFINNDASKIQAREDDIKVEIENKKTLREIRYVEADGDKKVIKVGKDNNEEFKNYVHVDYDENSKPVRWVHELSSTKLKIHIPKGYTIGDYIEGTKSLDEDNYGRIVFSEKPQIVGILVKSDGQEYRINHVKDGIKPEFEVDGEKFLGNIFLEPEETKRDILYDYQGARIRYKIPVKLEEWEKAEDDRIIDLQELANKGDVDIEIRYLKRIYPLDDAAMNISQEIKDLRKYEIDIKGGDIKDEDLLSEYIFEEDSEVSLQEHYIYLDIPKGTPFSKGGLKDEIDVDRDSLDNNIFRMEDLDDGLIDSIRLKRYFFCMDDLEYKYEDLGIEINPNDMKEFLDCKFDNQITIYEDSNKNYKYKKYDGLKLNVKDLKTIKDAKGREHKLKDLAYNDELRLEVKLNNRLKVKETTKVNITKFFIDEQGDFPIDDRREDLLDKRLDWLTKGMDESLKEKILEVTKNNNGKIRYGKDIKFSLYDLDEIKKTLEISSDDPEEIKKLILENLDKVFEKDSVAFDITDENGLATIDNVTDGEYVLLENFTDEVDLDETKMIALPTILKLPMKDKDNNKIKEINIFPKNINTRPEIKKFILSDEGLEEERESFDWGENFNYRIDIKLKKNINNKDYKNIIIEEDYDDLLDLKLDKAKFTIVGEKDLDIKANFIDNKWKLTEIDIQKINNLFKDKNELVLRLEIPAEINLSGEKGKKYTYGEDIPNQAILRYGFEEEKTKEIESNKVFVWTGERSFKKMDGTTMTGLKGAEFNIYREEDGENIYLCKKDNGFFWSSDSTMNRATYISDDKGDFNVGGLKMGSYFYEEVVAPEGYVNLVRGEFFIVKENIKDVEIINRKTMIPETGSSRALLMLVGGVLMMGSGIYIIKKEKSSQTNLK